MIRQIDRIEGNGLKRATRQLVRGVGGIEAAAGLLGAGHSTVGRWQNRDDRESWINLAAVRQLEDDGGEALVTAELARLAGGIFVPLPDGSGDETQLAARLLEVMQRVGLVAGSTQAAIADGRCDAAEACAVRLIVAEALAALAQFDGQLAEIERSGLAMLDGRGFWR